MAKRSLDVVYMGMLSKDGYFESYTERQVRSKGGDSKRKPSGYRYLYHHGWVFRKLSPRKDWEDIYAKDSTLRFTRKQRCDVNTVDRDNFVINGEASMKPFEEQNRKQIAQLARLLTGVGISPKVKFEGAPLSLPRKVAPYQRKAIGTLEEFIK
jgi:hypothetical protein